MLQKVLEKLETSEVLAENALPTPTQYFKHYLAIAVAVQWIAADAEICGGTLTVKPVMET